MAQMYFYRTKMTMEHVTWNNWITKYFNSIFGQYSGKLSEISFLDKHLQCINNKFLKLKEQKLWIF